MGTFHELVEFERRFDAMDVEELKRWKWYWTRHAQHLAPKARNQAMKRVYEIEKVIAQKGGKESDARELEGSGSSPGVGVEFSPRRKPKRWPGASCTSSAKLADSPARGELVG